MGKRVKIVTKCGDVSFHDFEQDVESVEIVEKKNVVVKGSSVFFDEVPKYQYFQLRDRNGKFIATFHLCTNDTRIRKHNMYFTGGHKVNT